MIIEEKLIRKKKAVESRLSDILSREDSILFQAMRYSVLSGGKRFRPLLALSSGECFGVSIDIVLPFACAIELIHNYSLIHDDLPSMDNDDFRRGQPSCHRAYGENVAILAGNALLTLAFEVTAKAHLDGEFSLKKEQVITDLSHLAGAEGMIGGQFLDITLPSEKISEEKLYELILRKTGALIIASVKIGPVLAGASSSQIKAIEEYGKNIGIAFQIRDDILDSASDKCKSKLQQPNFVSLFGLEESKYRLKKSIELGIMALDDLPLKTDDLRFLALKLSKIKNGKKDE